MANVYGSSLDSMMQNEAAQQASAQNEANSYRNFLNNSANTNLRRREGDSLDRYRAGDIDVRRLDTTGMNDYRRGMITNDNARIGSLERLGTLQSNNQYNLGLNTNQTSVTNTDRNARANELNYNNLYNLGLDSNRASVTNVARNAQANEFNSTNQYNLGLDTNRTSAGNAALPYDRMTATQRAQFDAFGAAGLRPQNENLALLNASAANERAASERTAYQNTLNELNTNYNNQTTGFWGGAASPNDVNTQGIQAEMRRLASSRPGVEEESLYNEALGNYGRQVYAARNPGSNAGGTISYPPTLTELPDSMIGTNRPAPLIRKTKGGVEYQVN